MKEIMGKHELKMKHGGMESPMGNKIKNPISSKDSNKNSPMKNVKSNNPLKV
jgi:hypothetical protein